MSDDMSRRPIGTVVVSGCLLIVAAWVIIDWTTAGDALASYVLGGLIVAFALVVGAATMSDLGWRATLAALGSRTPLGDALGTAGLLRVAAYLPGSPWSTYAHQHIRLDLHVPDEHIEDAATRVAVTRMTIGGALGLAFVLMPLAGAPTWLSWAIAVLPVVALPAAQRAMLSPWAALRALGWQQGSIIVGGLALAALVAPFRPLGEGDLALLIGAVGLAAAGGLAANRVLGSAAPAGLGVSDIVLWGCLLTLADPGAAALVTLLARTLTAAADVALAGVASTSTGFRRWRQHTGR